MRTVRTALWLVLIAVLAGSALVGFGAYNVAATDQHTEAVYWLLKLSMRQSVRARARNVRVPDLTDAAQIDRGRALYQAHCVRCHGAPGVAPESFALGLRPVPSNLAHSAREWSAAELYWTMKFGLKMTAMPAWEYRLPEAELWAIVAYLQRMPEESPQQYAMQVRDVQRFAVESNAADSPSSRPGDAARGRKAIQQYACTTCHRIPGETGLRALVGPPLDAMGRRGFIAGLLPNTPENMARWLQSPQEIHPGSAMPNLGVTARDARDMAAYLHTLQ